MRPLLLLATLLTVACSGRHDGGDFVVAAEAAELNDNVLWVRWTTDEPGVSWIEYGTTEELGSTTVPGAEEGTDHEVLLAGLPAGRVAYWRAYTQVGEEVLESALQTTETGYLPADLPDVEDTNDDQTNLAAEGFTLVTTLGYGDPSSWVIAFDRSGRPCWWYEGEDGDETIAQARLSADGTSVLFNIAAEDRDVDLGKIVRVRLDGTVLSETITPLGHHDFVELPEGGGYAYLAADVEEYTYEDGETWPVVGDAIVEIEEGASEGVEVWSAWGSGLPVTVDAQHDDNFYGDVGLDWTHANNLVLDEANDEWLVSLRNMDALVKIDRPTGQLLWQLGGADGGDFRLTDGRPFEGQHSPELTDVGVLLFDNGEIGVADAYSRAVEYEIDVENGIWREHWVFDDGQRHTTLLMGDADRLENGNTLVSWGNLGRATEVTPDGTIAFQVDLGLGNPMGFTHHVAAIGGVP